MNPLPTSPGSHLIVALMFIVAASGCQSAYYKTMETFGYQKRDLLVSEVSDTRDAQQEAKNQFQDALEEFSAVTNFKGGELEETYDRLKAALDRSESRAAAVGDHIADVESVAKALFKEWEKELDQYSSESLRRSSEKKLRQTQTRYGQLIGVMKKAQNKTEPVLAAFRDQVLYLKHNLNAKAIASLQDELATVETDIAALIGDMEKAISEADAFISEMGDQ